MIDNAKNIQAQELTELLHDWKKGQNKASDELFSRVYPELKNIANRHMRSEQVGHTLQPTALVNEAYERLLMGSEVNWQDRQHFLCVLSNLMRRVLVDHARAKLSQKRGGGEQNLTLSENIQGLHNQYEVIDISEALDKYQHFSQRGSQMMEMRVFGGMENNQIASALDVSVKTVEREVRSARVWLARELRAI